MTEDSSNKSISIAGTPEIKLPCGDKSKFQTIDGVWVDYGNGAWMACRASNTSPCFTLRFEARDEKTLTLMQAIMYGKLKEYPEVQFVP